MEKGDEVLVDLLPAQWNPRRAFGLNADDVAEFLAGFGKPVFVEAQRGSAPQPNTPLPPRPILPRTTAGNPLAAVGLFYSAKRTYYHNAKDAMVIVLRELAKTDPSFLERCSQHPDAQGRKRRYIAQTPEELYPDREDLRDMRESLPGGWLVSTNLNNVLKKTIIQLAAEVAGLSFGKDVIVEF